MSQPIDLKTRLIKEVIPELQKRLGIKNPMAAPHITKITINVGVGTYTKQNKDYSNVVESITKITGQKPILTKAKKAISNFKTKKGEVVGIVVTLRGKRMYDFLNKLINIVFPRVRDFRGISDKAFDGKGNYNIGFKEHVVFAEISPDEVTRPYGMEISITTNAGNDKNGFELLKAMGFPFKKTA